MKLVDENTLDLFVANCHATIDAQYAMLKQEWKDAGTTPDPTPVPAKNLAEVALDVARENIGQKEATGHNDGPFVEKIQGYIEGPDSTWMKNQPWCAAFASWCIHQAAVRLGITEKFKKSASSSEIYDRAKADGTLAKDPSELKGVMIGLLKGDGGSPGKSHHHTFLANFEGTPAGVEWVYGIDGNWGDAVARTQHKVGEADFVRIG